MAREDLKYIIGFETNDTPVVAATKALKKLNDQQSFLEREYKKGVISQNVFKKGQTQLNNEIGKLRNATKQGGDALKQYITQMEASGKATRRKEIAMQQAGYQLQDFIVQVQSGTNPLIAFSQQGSQLAGFFAGPWGAAIGLGIAALGGLGTALLSTGAFADIFSSKFRDAKQAIKDLEKQGKESSSALNFLAFQLFGGPADEGIFGAKQALDAALLELSQRSGGRINAQNISDLTLQQVVGMPMQPLPNGGIAEAGKALEKDFLTAKELLAAYNSELATYEGTLKVQAQIAAKTKAEAAAKQEIVDLGNDVLNVFKQQADAEEKAREEAEQLKIEQDNLLNKLDLTLYKKGEILGLEGEALLIAQQRLQKEDILRQLAEKELDISDHEVRKLMQSLGLIQAMELHEFRLAQAKKDKLELEKKNKEALEDQKKLQRELERRASFYGKTMENSLLSIVDGTKSVKDAFRDMARDIVLHLYKVLVVQRAIRAFGGFLAGSSNAAIAGIGQGLTTYGQSYSGGGYTGNGPRAGGLDGKGGFMAMLHPNETVIDHTKGQSAEGVTVVQNINISTGVQQTVRNEIRTLMPQIADSAKAAVSDAKRRGGSYGRALA